MSMTAAPAWNSAWAEMDRDKSNATAMMIRKGDFMGWASERDYVSLQRAGALPTSHSEARRTSEVVVEVLVAIGALGEPISAFSHPRVRRQAETRGPSQ